MRLIDADALLEELKKTYKYFDLKFYIEEAPTIEPSEQYKKGFEDAKRAFELEYARESENMRKRNAELEVLLNAQKAIAEPNKTEHDGCSGCRLEPFKEDAEACKDLIKQDGQDYLDERDIPLLDMAIESLQTEDKPQKVIANIKVDTDEIVKRIKEEYDITDGWIPCSDRLPNYREAVLVSTFWGVRMAERDSVKEDGTDDFWYLFLDDATARPMYVYAWMPLPKPYREDGEEE